jgi:chromosome segregation ATPase
MNELQKFPELKGKIDDLSNRKIRLEERLKNEKERLEKLIKEISDKGYDPRKLTEIKAGKEKEFKETLDQLETSVTDISTKLTAIEQGS